MLKQIFYLGIPPEIFSISATEKILFDKCNFEEKTKLIEDLVRQKSLPITTAKNVI